MNFGISKETFENAVAEFEDESCPLCDGCEPNTAEPCGFLDCPYGPFEEPSEEELEAERREMLGRMQRV